MPKRTPARRVHDLSIGQLSARSGVTASALRFYEAKGLIRSHRTSGNQRRYPRDVLRRVAVIRVAQRTGVPLKVIRQALRALPSDRPPTAADWNRLSARWRDELNARIHQLTELRDRLGGCIGCGCMSGTAAPTQARHFTQVELGNGLTVDFMNTSQRVAMQHYAFLIDDAQFDTALATIRRNEQDYWADPYRHRPREINAHDGGRTVYFEDPSGHFLEIRTRPSR